VFFRKPEPSMPSISSVEQLRSLYALATGTAELRTEDDLRARCVEQGKAPHVVVTVIESQEAMAARYRAQLY